MTTTVTIPKEQFDTINTRLRYLENMVKKIAEKLDISETDTEEKRTEKPQEIDMDEFFG